MRGDAIKPISKKLVLRISTKISGILPHEANETIQKAGQLQPDQGAFVMNSTEGLNPEAQELVSYFFFAVYRTSQASGAKIRKISYDEIDEIFKKIRNPF